MGHVELHLWTSGCLFLGGQLVGVEDPVPAYLPCVFEPALPC